MEYPTLLRHPAIAPHRLTVEEVLPLTPEAYAVHQQAADWWVVTVAATGEVIYRGLGPVEVLRSRAPF
jgi:hypothetical protein